MQVAHAGRGVCIPLFLHNDVMAVLAITFSGGIGIVLFRFAIGLKAQKHLARGRASASPRVNRVKSFSPCKGKSIPVCHLFGERLLSFCISQY